ncbi:MAG: hypothetical protein IIC49_04650, partial [Planctomycetes bacterium]|nr:hypothetical protein [Planctomycetota bacterium]
MRAGLNLMAMGVAGTTIVLGGCQQSTGVVRVDPEMGTDVNPRFNDTDARQVAQALADEPTVVP